MVLRGVFCEKHTTLVIARQVRQRCGVLLPVLTVEYIYLNRLNMRALDAAQIDAKAIRIRARRIKRFYAAVLAKGVLGSAGVKGIGSHRVCTADQSKPGCRYNHLIATALVAN